MTNRIIEAKEFGSNFKPITRIAAENPLLVAQYYQEYLGFVFVAGNRPCNHFMLAYNNQMVLIKGNEKGRQSAPISIEIKTGHIEGLYYNVGPKVRLTETLHSDSFTVTDCIGNTIRFVKG